MTPPPGSKPAEVWQAKYRKGPLASADGREMICTFLADNLLLAINAMQDDMRLAGIAPMFDTQKLPLREVYVLAFDQLLPDRAKLSPPVAMMVSSAVTVTQRFWNRKKIAAAHDANPETQAFRERLRAEAAKKTEPAQAPPANSNEAAPIGPPMSPNGAPTMPAAPPEARPELPLNGRAVQPEGLTPNDPPSRGFDRDGLY